MYATRSLDSRIGRTASKMAAQRVVTDRALQRAICNGDVDRLRAVFTETIHVALQQARDAAARGPVAKATAPQQPAPSGSVDDDGKAVAGKVGEAAAEAVSAAMQSGLITSIIAGDTAGIGRALASGVQAGVGRGIQTMREAPEELTTPTPLRSEGRQSAVYAGVAARHPCFGNAAAVRAMYGAERGASAPAVAVERNGAGPSATAGGDDVGA